MNFFELTEQIRRRRLLCYASTIALVIKFAIGPAFAGYSFITIFPSVLLALLEAVFDKTAQLS